MKLFYSYMQTKLGRMVFVCDHQALYAVHLEQKGKEEQSFLYLKKRRKAEITEIIEGKPEVMEKALQEMQEYLQGKRKNFSVPLALNGTEFQKKVWEELKKIPYGETICYSELAARAGNPKASRAVGMANNKNPIMIIVPCHRVIGKHGDLVGYGGGLSAKQWLLELEAKHKPSLLSDIQN